MSLPYALTGGELIERITEFSEPPGHYHSDVLVSTESMFQWPIPELSKRVELGGAYLGVGPEQNLTYIAALCPAIAFIVDVRRKNFLLHLLYKAIFDLSDDRIRFLEWLFSRSRPSHFEPPATLPDLFRAFSLIGAEPTALGGTEAILDWLDRRGFALSEPDKEAVRSIHEAFAIDGPALSAKFCHDLAPKTLDGTPQKEHPTFGMLQSQTDGHGVPQSFLSSEARFRAVKDLHARNLIVPVIGNLAGTRSIRAIATYLRLHSAVATTWYVSNVEHYLFKADDWRVFYENASMVPIDPAATFIRSVSHKLTRPAHDRAGSATMTSGVAPLLEKFRQGAIGSLADVVAMSS